MGIGGGKEGGGVSFTRFPVFYFCHLWHISRVCLFDFDDLQRSFQLQRSPALAETAIWQFTDT